ncbi:MAG: aldo/keto reductase, partial [Clostridiales bacterium]|nr:aldo/keto reductase [Clostridiales bacterium]
MRYRALGKSGIKVSEIGLGCEHLEGRPEKDVYAVVERARHYGVNIFDVFMSEPNVRTYLGGAFAGYRKEITIQGHIGALWQNGQYARGRDLDACKRHFEDLLTRLRTDYIDVGMIHFIDSVTEWDEVVSSPVMEYARRLKAEGVIRTIGLSSHVPVTALRAVESGAIDVLMFSLNPAFDVLPESTELEQLREPESYKDGGITGQDQTRRALYAACEAAGVGVTVMKALASGLLLNAKSSPFGLALTAEQCVHYALSRPAVASVLPGCRTPAEVDQVMRYETAD